MIKGLRILNMVQGFTLLALLTVTWLYYIGWASDTALLFLLGGYALMFVAYLFVSLQVSKLCGWHSSAWLSVVVAGVLPFAFIMLERSLRRLLDESP